MAQTPRRPTRRRAGWVVSVLLARVSRRDIGTINTCVTALAGEVRVVQVGVEQ